MPHRNTDETTTRADVRNHGLRRVRYSTGLVTAASAAGVVVLAGGYAHAMPGKTATSTAKHTQTATAPSHAASRSPRGTTTPTKTAKTQQSTQAKTPTTSSTPTLQAPAQAPQTTSNSNTQSQATSGGS